VNGEIEINSVPKKSKRRNPTIIWFVSIIMSFCFGMLGSYFIIKNFSISENMIKKLITSELIETSVSTSADKVYNNILSNITPSGLVDVSIASSVEKVYDQTVSVVSISKGKQVSTGTGFIYKIENGKAYIMTNNHVIDDGDTARIEFNSGNERFDAKIIGGDIYSDIAVLTMNANDVLGVVEIGNSTDLKLGDTVFTVGTPMGIDYKGTVTKGIVSGIDRLVEVSLANNSTDYFMKVIQIDAAVNPGNSGGPLCDVSGKVIGVISLKIVQDEVEGMGFAIPIEDALEYANMIENGGKIVRPYVGISMIDLYQESFLNENGISVPKNISEGVVILDVVKDSPADKVNLQKGDVIVKLAGVVVGTVSEFRYELYKHAIGEQVEFTIVRNGKLMTVMVTLGKS